MNRKKMIFSILIGVLIYNGIVYGGKACKNVPQTYTSNDYYCPGDEICPIIFKYDFIQCRTGSWTSDGCTRTCENWNILSILHKYEKQSASMLKGWYCKVEISPGVFEWLFGGSDEGDEPTEIGGEPVISCEWIDVAGCNCIGPDYIDDSEVYGNTYCLYIDCPCPNKGTNPN